MLMHSSLKLSIDEYEKSCLDADQKILGALRNRSRIKANLQQVHFSSRNLVQSLGSLQVRPLWAGSTCSHH